VKGEDGVGSHCSVRFERCRGRTIWIKGKIVGLWWFLEVGTVLEREGVVGESFLS